MLSRRDLLKLSAMLAGGLSIPAAAKSAVTKDRSFFRFCLNTSTISGQHAGLLGVIDIASIAGYDGVELWMPDIRNYISQGNSIKSLAAALSERKIAVENIISFTGWLVDDDAKRKAALQELEEEMEIAAAIGCKRIAAPPAGLTKGDELDFKKAGARYREILAIGRKHNVIPQLEFWGASETLYNLSQAMAIAIAADDKDAMILPDIYHLFRGGSGFEGLSLINGKAIEIIHMNDYPASKPVDEQTDSDRIYPGDGAAPIKEVLLTLKKLGGTKVLSLELFNKDYWAQDALLVAKTGLQKMKDLVDASK